MSMSNTHCACGAQQLPLHQTHKHALALVHWNELEALSLPRRHEFCRQHVHRHQDVPTTGVRLKFKNSAAEPMRSSQSWQRYIPPQCQGHMQAALQTLHKQTGSVGFPARLTTQHPCGMNFRDAKRACVRMKVSKGHAVEQPTPFCCLRPGEVPEEGPPELWLPPLSRSLLCRCPCSNMWMSSSCRSLSARLAMPL